MSEVTIIINNKSLNFIVLEYYDGAKAMIHGNFLLWWNNETKEYEEFLSFEVTDRERELLLDKNISLKDAMKSVLERNEYDYYRHYYHSNILERCEPFEAYIPYS